MKNPKSIRQILWTQDWGTYGNKTVVCCGFQIQEIIDDMNRQGCTEWARAVSVRKEDFERMGKTSHFFSKWYVNKGDTEISYSLLYLRHWKPDVHHYKILAHELVHAISFVMPDYMDALNENEAFAHQHSYLFDSIATKLNEWYSRRNEKKNLAKR